MTDGALAEWLPQPGTDLYYALLFLDPLPRERLGVLEALRGTVARIPASCSSPTVALSKLAWWRDEIGLLARGTPRHVLTRALTPAAPGLIEALRALVDGTEALLGGRVFADRAARRNAFATTHGPLWSQGLALLSGKAPPQEALTLAVLVEEAYALRDARPLIEGGCGLLTHAAGACSGDEAAWYRQALAADIEACRHDLALALAALPGRRRWRPLATLARLARATLDEIAASNFPVWESRIELTPLRKVLLALRERLGC